jgi:hypothetical protein
MYKQLFVLLFNLISYPIKTWGQLAEEQDTNNNEDFYKSYLYPIIGTIALLSFLGILFSGSKFDLQIALKTVIKESVAYFFGFYVASFGLSRMIPLFEQEVKMQICERFVGYSCATIYVIAMVYDLFQVLFPTLIFAQIFIFYAAYTIWLGAIHYLKIKEEYLTKFTIFASILILFSPILIRWILSLMVPGLK